MERYAKFTPGEYYHVCNRGINKNKIFLANGDWTYFQRLLHIRNDSAGSKKIERYKDKPLREIDVAEPLVDIQAYSLLDNHFHLLLSERKEGGISTYMKRLLTSYSMYINKKYDRSGPLMCRPFRSSHVHSDEYMRWLISYIHLNPIDIIEPGWKEVGIKDVKKAGAFLQDYEYSSYTDYFCNDRDASAILNKESLPFFINDLEKVETMLHTYHTHLMS